MADDLFLVRGLLQTEIGLMVHAVSLKVALLRIALHEAELNANDTSVPMARSVLEAWTQFEHELTRGTRIKIELDMSAGL